MKLYDHLMWKECWLWCRLAPDDGDLRLERIGISPKEEAFHEWLSKRTLVPFDWNSKEHKSSLDEEAEKMMELGVPTWLRYELDQEDLAGIIAMGFDHRPKDEMQTWARFGLEEGIAPFQPFLLRFKMPHYSKTWTDCGYEYDTEYYWDVMRIIPWEPSRVLKRWEHYLKEFITWTAPSRRAG